jgi:hypothetical protein
MRKVALVLALIALTNGTAFSQAQQKLRDLPRGQQPARRQNIPPRRAALQEIIVNYYVSQFRQSAELSDEVFLKVMPFLEGFVRNRLEITERRRIALNQLRMALDSGSPDDDIRRLNGELSEADVQIHTNQQEFMKNVDPLLNVRQQGRLRILLDMTDQQVRKMIISIQNPAQGNR